jgi:glycosyltransferase involved in cell wall biosynthesis
MTKKWLKLGWNSAAPFATTGYGEVTWETVRRLIKCGWNIDCIDGSGGQYTWGGRMENYRLDDETTTKVLPTAGKLGGEDVMPHYIQSEKYDMVLSLWDSFVINYLQKLKVPAIYYIPIDGDFTSRMHGFVKGGWKTVTYSKWGYREASKRLPLNKLDYIPHGFDSKSWEPKESDFRDTLSPKVNDDDFLVFTVGANVSERKQLPLLMKVFAQFCKKHHDVKMFIMTNTGGGANFYDVRGFASKFGISDRIIMPERETTIYPYSREEMVEMHSAADVYAMSSMAEGFGMPAIQSKFCEVPVILPENSAQTEMVGKSGWKVKLNDDYTFIPMWVPTIQEYYVPSMRDLLRCLEESYKEWESGELKERGKQARKEAMIYDFDNVMPRWDRLLTEAQEYLVYDNKIKEMLEKGNV